MTMSAMITYQTKINYAICKPYPLWLFPEEVAPAGNPYHVINLFFGWENFPAWRAHLNQWKQAALLPGYQMDNEQTLQTFIRYEYLDLRLHKRFYCNRINQSCGKWSIFCKEPYWYEKIHCYSSLGIVVFCSICAAWCYRH